jgi:Methyltransferase domain
MIVVITKLGRLSRLNRVLGTWLLTMVAMKIPQLFPPGHFYSPLVDPQDVNEYLNTLQAGGLNGCEGIDLQTSHQLELLASLKATSTLWRKRSPELKGGPRYSSTNDQYGVGDAASFAGIIGHFKPKRIVEVGSGWSSAVALDASEVLGLSIQHTFIEPYPDRLHSALRRQDRDRVVIHEQPVQTVSMKSFQELERNDILFIDSTHVYKPGSDVQYLINVVLPRLADGVLVHVHDMFFPFEYPSAWILEGRNWNELYMMRSLLQDSCRYAIRFWNHYLAATHHSEAIAAIPELGINPGGGLWLSVGDGS